MPRVEDDLWPPEAPRPSACRPSAQPLWEELSDDAIAEVRADPAGEWWRALAAGLAGQPRVRHGRRVRGRDGSRTTIYPARDERPLTAALPSVPAAVRVYDDLGKARAIPLDFDTGLASGAPGKRQGQVEADAAAAADLLLSMGARVVVDRSPRGGWHVWVPLATPATREELEPVLRALQARFRTLDLKPALNVAAGCLRPPGAHHPDGGRQELVTPLPVAVEAVTLRSDPALLARLRQHLASAITDAQTTTRLAGQGPAERVDDRETARAGHAVPLDALHRAIAETGVWPADKRTPGGVAWSPSEARQSVLASAAARGFCLRDVLAHVESGQWSGLTRLYARYGRHARGALVRDWRKALAYARLNPPPQPHLGAVSNSHTRGKPPTHGGATGRRSGEEYRFVRGWAQYWQTEATTRWTGRSSYAIRAVLVGLARMAQLNGSRYLEVGCRSLTLSAGMLDHSTVAAVLRQLRDEPDGPIQLLEADRGARGDLYELVLPQQQGEEPLRRVLPTGNLPGVHPVFGEVGLPEWCVYEALGAAGGGTAPELAETAAMSRGEAYKALNVLAAHGLVAKVGTVWRRTRLRLNTLARRLNVRVSIAARQSRYRVERAAWRAVLDVAGRSSTWNVPVAAVPTDPLLWPDTLTEPPGHDDGHATPLQLLAEVLGAVPLTPHWLTVLDRESGVPAGARGAL